VTTHVPQAATLVAPGKGTQAHRFPPLQPLRLMLSLARSSHPRGPPRTPLPSHARRSAALHADVWALGCVMYEATALKPAFSAFNMSGLVQKVGQPAG
jgi:serine/threonine protein kinase